ncbi:MAG: hypothetical protein AVDCRST_MAG86-4160 [uncultured Truepera sp.]|uniref:Uncharacterized protein n=1 Tax=uncultured Truepera sp. TaxID=543023 RepID=A0A6J4VUU2_9DEIN|nr:MAG: hypothetical protein AVDCRST_MAG86-4160 [uncultured Truepera sp.]
MNIPGIPIELIIAVLFFALPALGSLQKRLRERRQRETSTERAPPPARPAATLTRADTATAPATRGQAEGWLEEAQRRVREARQEEAAKGGRGGVNPRTLPQTPVHKPAAKPAPKPARPPQPSRPAATRDPRPSLEGRTLEGRSLETYRPENASLERSGGGAAVSTTAPPLRVQRLGGGGHATIARELRFDERALMTGFIWSQVLSPPVSKRRTLSSRRQP